MPQTWNYCKKLWVCCISLLPACILAKSLYFFHLHFLLLNQQNSFNVAFWSNEFYTNYFVTRHSSVQIVFSSTLNLVNPETLLSRSISGGPNTIFYTFENPENSQSRQILMVTKVSRWTILILPHSFSPTWMNLTTECVLTRSSY